METSAVLSTTSRQLVPAEPLPWLDDDSLPRPELLDGRARTAYIGRVRLPIAGPYRPWARLYRLPDRRLLWVVRLWHRDRAVRRVTSTPTLLEFARLNRLGTVAARVRSLDRRGRSEA
ncbi:MAG: hypothetical protein L3K14_01820 [Thermoplasmata archaeon]|nr:hypothetical protein [Thermoplasmata archaeon]